jgi:hypothetical protein
MSCKILKEDGFVLLKEDGCALLLEHIWEYIKQKIARMKIARLAISRIKLGRWLSGC